MSSDSPFSYLFPDFGIGADPYLAALAIPRQNILDESLNPVVDYNNLPVYDRATTDATSLGQGGAATGLSSLALGAYSLASQDYTVAAGYRAQALGQYSTAVGEEAYSSAYAGTVVGRLAVSKAIKSTAIGHGVFIAAVSTYGTAVGEGAMITAGTGNTVIGQGSSASGSNDTIVGQGSSITMDSSTSVGQGTSVTGARSTAVGKGAAAAFDDCVVVGASAFATASGQVIIGSATQTVSTIYLGRGVTHTGSAQVTEIHASNASGVSIAGDNLQIYGGTGTDNADGGTVSIWTSSAGIFGDVKGYWTMDQVSGTRTDSLGNNNLTDNNTVTSATGKISLAAQFTSANSEFLSASVGAGNVLQLGNIDFTFWAWVYLDTKAASMSVAGQWISGDATRSWVLDYETGADRFSFTVYNGSASTSVNSTITPVSTATWYLVFVWREIASSTINIQVNNNTPNSTTLSTAYPQVSTMSFRFGARADGSLFWNGRIDEAGISKTALNSGQRAAIYNSGTGITYATGVAGIQAKRLQVDGNNAAAVNVYTQLNVWRGATPTLMLRAKQDGTVIYTGDGNEPAASAWTNQGLMILGPVAGTSSGSSGNSGVILFNNTTSDATIGGYILVNASYLAITSDRQGSGSFIPIHFFTNHVDQASLDTGGFWKWGAYGAGAITADASGNLTSVSDERLKDIQPGGYPYGLSEILQIDPILYKWRPESKLETEMVYPGFRAQQIKSLMPESVGVTRVGLLTLQDRGILGAVVQAIKQIDVRLVGAGI